MKTEKIQNWLENSPEIKSPEIKQIVAMCLETHLNRNTEALNSLRIRIIKKNQSILKNEDENTIFSYEDLLEILRQKPKKRERKVVLARFKLALLFFYFSGSKISTVTRLKQGDFYQIQSNLKLEPPQLGGKNKQVIVFSPHIKTLLEELEEEQTLVFSQMSKKRNKPTTLGNYSHTNAFNRFFNQRLKKYFQGSSRFYEKKTNLIWND